MAFFFIHAWTLGIAKTIKAHVNLESLVSVHSKVNINRPAAPALGLAWSLGIVERPGVLSQLKTKRSYYSHASKRIARSTQNRERGYHEA